MESGMGRATGGIAKFQRAPIPPGNQPYHQQHPEPPKGIAQFQNRRASEYAEPIRDNLAQHHEQGRPSGNDNDAFALPEPPWGYSAQEQGRDDAEPYQYASRELLGNVNQLPIVKQPTSFSAPVSDGLRFFNNGIEVDLHNNPVERGMAAAAVANNMARSSHDAPPSRKAGYSGQDSDDDLDLAGHSSLWGTSNRR
jgi:hypothetical protein